MRVKGTLQSHSSNKYNLFQQDKQGGLLYFLFYVLYLSLLLSDHHIRRSYSSHDGTYDSRAAQRTFRSSGEPHQSTTSCGERLQLRVNELHLTTQSVNKISYDSVCRREVSCQKIVKMIERSERRIWSLGRYVE